MVIISKMTRIIQHIEYMHGFNDTVTAAPGLQRLTSLEVVKVILLEESSCDSEFTEPYLYECKSKTRNYLLNQCFLEVNKWARL